MIFIRLRTGNATSFLHIVHCRIIHDSSISFCKLYRLLFDDDIRECGGGVFSFVVGDVESYYQQQQLPPHVSSPLVVVMEVVVAEKMILEVYDVHVQIPILFHYQPHFLSDQLFCELLLVRRLKHYELRHLSESMHQDLARLDLFQLS